MQFSENQNVLVVSRIGKGSIGTARVAKIERITPTGRITVSRCSRHFQAHNDADKATEARPRGSFGWPLFIMPDTPENRDWVRNENPIKSRDPIGE